MILSILFILSIYIIGFVLTQKLSSSFIIGSLISVTSIFILFFISKNLYISFFIYLLIFSFIIYHKKYFLKNLIKINKFYLIFYIFIFILTFLVFDRTFSYESTSNTFLIQSNLYQDFGSRIANIRYFSNGGIIPEVPYYAGKNLLYHFLFEFYAGIMEFLGLRIDIAFNLISALTLTSFIFILYEFSSWLFKDKIVGLLTPILFILGSDLSFLQIIKKYGTLFSSYYHHNTYFMGEFLGNEIGKNFLNINTIVNQRHLMFGLAVLVFILYSLLSKDKFNNFYIIFIALIISLLPFWHVQILIAVYITLISLALLIKEKRTEFFKVIFLSSVFVIPQLLLIKLNSVNELILRPGFTMADNLSFETFTSFWIWNLGFVLVFVTIALIKSNRIQQKVFISFLALFIIANIFQFGRDMFDNHKLFNAFVIIISMFSAYGFMLLIRKTFFYKLIALFGIILMTISGIINLLIIKNDVYANIPDTSTQKIGKWIKNNMSNNDITLTNGEIYDPVALVGLRTFLGRSHYVYLFGGDPSDRINEKSMILDGKNIKEINSILRNNSITYIIIYKEDIAPNITLVDRVFFDKNYNIVYEDDVAIIYKI